MLEAGRIRIPDDELEFSFARSSGPGGQNVNKVNSKAFLRWNAAGSPSVPMTVRARLLTLCGSRLTTEGVLVLSSQRFRDAPKNQEDCRTKLIDLLLRAQVVPKTRRPTRPTKAAKERRISEKRKQSERKASRRPPAGED